MTGTLVEIRHNDASISPLGALDSPTRDALADYVRRRWPVGTAKEAAREWGLTLDEARGIVAGRTSIATMDRIFKHPNGGWSVAVPVMGAVIGHGLDDFIEMEKARHERARRDLEDREQRLVAMARDLPAVLGLRRRGDGGLSDRRAR